MQPSSTTERLGRYQLLERLGKGGMGEVYLAKHAGPMGVVRFVALKRVLPDKLDAEDHRGDNKLAQMFIDEMRLAVRLTHPNIVSVHDFGVEDSAYFLAMEFIGGVDAYQVLKRSVLRQLKTTDVTCALYVAAQVARGLDYAHRLTDGAGQPLAIVHRDVTPANVLLSFGGDVKLADFGVAHATQKLRQTRTETGELKGKIRYMSPEQAKGLKQIDHRSDLFSLGTVLLELLTLRPAFEGESEIQSLLQVQSGRPADWAMRVPLIPDDVLPILEKAMAPEPSDRFASGAEMGEALEVALRRREPGFGPPKLAAYLESLFAKEQQALRERMARYESGFEEEQVSAVIDISTDESASGVTGRLTPGDRTDFSPPPVRARARWWIAGVGLVALGAAGVAAVMKIRKPANDLPAPIESPAVGTLPTPATVTSPIVPSAAAVAAGAPARLLISTNTVATRVFLDKSESERSKAPVAAGGMSFRIEVPAGENFILRLEAQGHEPLTMPIRLAASEEKSLPLALTPIAATALLPHAAPGHKKAHGSESAKPTAPEGKPGAKPAAADGKKDDFMNPFDK